MGNVPSKKHNPKLVVKIPNHIVDMYASKHGVSHITAERLARELEKFLWTAHFHLKSLVPSAKIDEIWHDFILHTQDYTHFCATNFGQLIHHQPQLSSSSRLRRMYLTTIDILKREFVYVPRDIWPQDCAQHGKCEVICATHQT